jgi:hypothetical protein
MVPDSRVQALLERWQQGQPLSIEDLCRDCPELLPELERQIALLPQASPEKPDDILTIVPATADLPVPPPSPDMLPRLPGYEVLEELGHGGMGVVYLARQIHLNRVVALKMIRSGAQAAPEERRRFLAEARAAAEIEHPGIVRVFDLGTHQGQPFFASELCSGGSLARLLRGKPLSAAQAAAIVELIASAVEAAHQRGIVHRDLKPNNILLDGEGQPKVADFGLAKRLEGGRDLTRSGAILGTPSYMAPEQAQGKKDLGPAADVWALGAILYECLTGRPPFRAATDYDTLMQVVADEPVPVRRLEPDVPRDLEAICLKCLEKQPGQRYASARDLADDLRRFRTGDSVRARPARLHSRAMRWARRRLGVGAALAGVAAALVVGALVGSRVIQLSREGELVRAKHSKEMAEPKWTRALRNELELFAAKIKVLLEEERADGITVGEFTSPPNQPAPITGPVIQRQLTEALKAHAVPVLEDASLYIKGEYFVLDSTTEKKRPGRTIRLEATVRNKQFVRLLDLEAEIPDLDAINKPVAATVGPAKKPEVDNLGAKIRKENDPPERISALRKELDGLAAKLKVVVEEERADGIAVGEFSGPPRQATSTGSGIQQLLITSLRAQKVTIKEDASLYVKGEYSLIDDPRERDRHAVKLEVTVRNTKGAKLRDLTLVVPLPP